MTWPVVALIISTEWAFAVTACILIWTLGYSSTFQDPKP